MPIVFKVGGIKFFFYSNDHRPVHVHVEAAGASAKIEIDPLRLIENKGFSPSAIAKIMKLVADNKDKINATWEKFFGKKS